MGISVSVDSWIDQTISELADKSYPENDEIYSRLIECSTTTSEIFLVSSDLISSVVKCEYNNTPFILKKCLEELISNELQRRINAASILSRFLPHLISNSSETNLLTYLLTPTEIFHEKTSPGEYIVSTSLNLLSSLSSEDSGQLIQNIEMNNEIFDLLSFVIFACLKFYKNSTLYHQLLVYCEKHGSAVISIFLNYVHCGGRKCSIISLLSMLLFHPTGDFLPSADVFIKNGGVLSQNLMKDTGTDDDFICFLAALAFQEDVNIKVQLSKLSKPGLIRIALAKILMGKAPYNISPSDLIFAYNTTQHSLLSRALSKNIINQSDNLQKDVPPLDDFEFTTPTKSKWFIEWVSTAIPQLFIFSKSLWFVGTENDIELPDLSVIDQLVTIKST